MVERIYRAPHYPDLEAALVHEIVARKAADPLSRLLVLVPSAPLCRRLAVRFAAEEGLSLLNVERLTFHQFASRLASARGVTDDFFFEEALRHLLQSSPPSPFSPLLQTAGGCTALWRTLCTLEEAHVDAAMAKEACTEGLLPGEAAPLFDFYARWCDARRCWTLQHYGDVTTSAAMGTATSDLLKTCNAIFYYGFYDLTQVQIDLLQSVARHYPVRIFIPRASDEAWAFSQQFDERHLAGLLSAYETGDAPETLASTRLAAHVQILPCRDLNDEVNTVAREIVRLVERGEIAYHEIGIVAPDIAPYLFTLAWRFEKYGIPVSISAERPLTDFPYVDAIRLLLSLPRGSLHGPAKELAVGDRGSSDGALMTGLLASPYFSGNTDFDLRAEIDALSRVSSWADHVDRWRRIIQTVLIHSSEARDGTIEGYPEEQLAGAVMDALESLAVMDGVTSHVGHLEFVEAFKRRLLAAGVPWTDATAGGVMVLDAVSARGVCCRVLFIVGLTDSALPRPIREDPLLPDSVRRAVETTLGNKLDEKQSGLDEDRLLFVLLAGSARERLYCLYPKSTAAGEQRPSRYLDTIRRLASKGLQEATESAVPEIDLIPPDEAAVRLRLVGRDVAPLLTPSVRNIYRRGCRMMAALSSNGGLTAYDGLTGGDPAHRLRREGLSPTGLVRYATCPFQFFARDLLGLCPPTDLQEEVDGIAPTAWGLLCHEILADYYRTQIEGGVATLKEIADVICARYAGAHPVRFPLAWEARRERLIRTLERVVEQDLHESEGFQPVAVEAECRGRIGSFPIAGRIDRIDEAGARCRIIDYKYSEKKDPSVDGLQLLQLSIYLHLVAGQRVGQGQKSNMAEAAFFYILPNRPQGPLKTKTHKPAEADAQTLLQLAKAVEAGRFFIRTGAHCRNCGIATLCRRAHLPSRRRATQGFLAAADADLAE